MIKKVLLAVVAGVVLVGSGLFVGSISSGASSSWANELASKANLDLGKVGFAKKDELVKTDLTEVMGEAIDPKLKEEEAALELLMQEYYDMKVAGLTGTQAYKDLEKQIEAIKFTIFERYKADIDSVFAK